MSESEWLTRKGRYTSSIIIQIEGEINNPHNLVYEA